MLIQLENLISISDGPSLYTEESFNQFNLLKNYSYTFVGETEIFSIAGSDIKYVEILKIND